MGVEIERKFLVRNGSWHLASLPRHHIRQGYFTPPGNPLSIRIRIVDQQSAVITLKSTHEGLSREEYEYPIPLDDALTLIASASGCIIEKTRFIWMEGDDRSEIDRFEGENAGLVVAEIELPREDAPIKLPDWIGEEVSDVSPATETHPYRACPLAAGDELSPEASSSPSPLIE